MVELGARRNGEERRGKDLGSVRGSGGLRANVNNSLDVNRALSSGRKR